MFPGGIRDSSGEIRISTCNSRKIRHPAAFHAESQKETQSLALFACNFGGLRVVFIFHVDLPDCRADFSNSALSFGFPDYFWDFRLTFSIFRVRFPDSAL